MIIIISDNHFFANEANIVNSLFDKGLELFHLRKYNNSESEIRAFVNEIKHEYRNRIVLHQFHEMADEFGIKRLHFSEKDRLNSKESELLKLKQNGFHLSTSVHTVEEYQKLASAFDYCFLSPVFDSISKPGYNAQVFHLPSKNTSVVKIIALGGIKENNCLKALEMGFDGVALLGTIWKSENKVETFNKINHALQQTYSH